MNKYHSGYYLPNVYGINSLEEFSNIQISAPELKLISSNYKGKEWYIDWEYNDYLGGYEFIINSKSFEIAQNVLFNVLCAAAVINGTILWSNEAHSPIKFGTIRKGNEKEINKKNVISFSDSQIPNYFYLASLASKDISLANSITKFQLSTEIYSQHYIDLHEVIDWKTTDYTYIQMRFAYAIVVAYSIIEELGLEIRATKENPSRLKNGEWNPVVLEELNKRLVSSKINIKDDISWMIRGQATKIEIKKSITTSKLTEWSDPPSYENDFFIRINDGYVSLHDAIDYISFLRSKISSHRVGERIMDLSVFDVANSQNLARRLILEKIGQWR